MNGFASHGLDEGAFGEKGSNIVQAFDAFRKFLKLLHMIQVYLGGIGSFAFLYIFMLPS